MSYWYDKLPDMSMARPTAPPSDLFLLRRRGRRWVDTPQDPGEPINAELQLVAGVVVRGGIGRKVPPRAQSGGEWRRRPSRTWLWGLAVDRHHDGPVRAVFRPHTHLRVGAVGHDGHIGGVVVPPVDQVVTAD